MSGKKIDLSRRRRLIKIVLIAGVICLAVIALLEPPDDTIHMMHVTPRFNKFQRFLVMQKWQSGGKPRLPFLPKSVHFRSNGPPVRLYLLDFTSLSDAKERVAAMMRASEQIEQGRDPDPQWIRGQAANVREGRFVLHYWPWGHAEYMLILASDQDVALTVRVSYAW